MRRFLTIAALLVAAGGVIFARSAMQSPRADAGKEPQKRLIDLKSDNMGPVAPGDSVIFLVGNFAAQHNGAVITCDSAVRYSDMRIEFFGNVLINKNTTYIYGDRAEYDGNLNEARVYSNLVKVVDGDATLYTYRFIYNTKENVGEFAGGGVLTNRENRLESVRGYYMGDTRDLICVERVEMRNDEYELKGDSVVYNMGTDNAFFFDNTNIWNKEGDYLQADRGSYLKLDTLYRVTRNGYVLTPTQEMWGDSIDYFRAANHVVLWGNIQIDDTEHKVLAFGDFGEYWKEPGNAILTRRPSVVSYDLSQGDSLYMCADSMFLFTLRGSGPDHTPQEGKDSLGRASGQPSDIGGSPDIEQLKSDMEQLRSNQEGPRLDGGKHDAAGQGMLSGGAAIAMPTPSDGSSPDRSILAGRDSLSPNAASGFRGINTPDSLQSGLTPADSLSANVPDSLAAVDTLTVAEHKTMLKEAVRKAKAEKKLAAAKEKKILLDSIAAHRRVKTNAKLLAQKEREEARLSKQRAKVAARLAARREKALRKGKLFPIDSTTIKGLDSLLDINMNEQDSLLNLLADSLLRDTSLMALPADSLLLPRDSIYRLMKGYHNVKIFRSDVQAVCDSIVAIGSDSTVHLYIDPVLWNQSNQMTSDLIDIYTANQQLDRAEFIGSPLMASQLDTVHYNQVAGKAMTARFFNNQIYRNDVNGNAQTIYYMEDGEPPEITMMGVVESGDCSFYIEDKEVVQIVYRNEITDAFYPMDKIPPTQELYLKNFKWEGDRRPALRDVFDRTIRPTRRAQESEMQHPQFPIMQRIDADKRRLIEQRRWVDRNDEVDAPTAEWMHDLGFEVGQPRPRPRPAATESTPDSLQGRAPIVRHLPPSAVGDSLSHEKSMGESLPDSTRETLSPAANKPLTGTGANSPTIDSAAVGERPKSTVAPSKSDAHSVKTEPGDSLLRNVQPLTDSLKSLQRSATQDTPRSSDTLPEKIVPDSTPTQAKQ